MTEVVAKLDDLGQPAWIGVMVLGFILFWPAGLAILAYLLWSGRMGCGRNGSWGDPRARWERKMTRIQEKMDRWSGGAKAWQAAGGGFSSTGNNAFDEYRSQTIQRLEEEAREFRSYLDRLRHAKDKAEFDQFMNDRRNRPVDNGPQPGADQPPRG
jgi:hypothetical protein